MEIELEKKWLLKCLPKLPSEEFELLTVETFNQSYISSEERVRVITEHYPDDHWSQHIQYFTKKSVGEGSSIENMIQINESKFQELKSTFIRSLEKVRTTFLHKESGYRYEFDCISPDGINSTDENYPRMIVLEIEFQDKFKTMDEVNENLKLPEFLEEYVLLDATGNKKFSNFNLAKQL